MIARVKVATALRRRPGTPCHHGPERPEQRRPRLGCVGDQRGDLGRRGRLDRYRRAGGGAFLVVVVIRGTPSGQVRKTVSRLGLSMSRRARPAGRRAGRDQFAEHRRPVYG